MIYYDLAEYSEIYLYICSVKQKKSMSVEQKKL